MRRFIKAGLIGWLLAPGCSIVYAQKQEPFTYHLVESYFYVNETPEIQKIVKTIFDLDPASERMVRDRPFEKIDALILNPASKISFDPEGDAVKTRTQTLLSTHSFSFKDDEFLCEYVFDQREWTKKYLNPIVTAVAFGDILVTKNKYELKIYDLSGKGDEKGRAWVPPGQNGEKNYWTLTPPHQNTIGRDLVGEGESFVYAELDEHFYKLSILSKTEVQLVWEHPLGNWSLIARPVLIKNQVLLNLINSKMEVVLLVLDKTSGAVLKSYFLGVTSFLSPMSTASLKGKDWVFMGTHHGFSYLYSANDMTLKWIQSYPAKNYDLFYYWANFNTVDQGLVPLDGEALWLSDQRKDKIVYYKSYESSQIQALDLETGKVKGQWSYTAGEVCLGGLGAKSYWLDKNNKIFAWDLASDTRKIIASLPAGDFRGSQMRDDSILVKIHDAVYSVDVKGSGENAPELLKTQYPSDWLLESNSGSKIFVGSFHGLAVYDFENIQRGDVKAASVSDNEKSAGAREYQITEKRNRIQGFALSLVPLKGAESNRKDFLLAAGDELMLVDKSSGNIKWSRRILRNDGFTPPAGAWRTGGVLLSKREFRSAEIAWKNGREVLIVKDEANVLVLDKESGALLESERVYDPNIKPTQTAILAELESGGKTYLYTRDSDLIVNGNDRKKKKLFERNFSVKGIPAGSPQIAPWGKGIVLFSYQHLWWMRDVSQPVNREPLPPGENYFFKSDSGGGFVAANPRAGVFFYEGPGKFRKIAWRNEVNGDFRGHWESSDGHWFAFGDSFYFIPKPEASASLKQRLVKLKDGRPYAITATTNGNDLWCIVSTMLSSDEPKPQDLFEILNRLIKLTSEGQTVDVGKLPNVTSWQSGRIQIEVDSDSYRWSIGETLGIGAL